LGTENTCDTIIPIEDVIIFEENVSAFDVEPIRIEWENAWNLCKDKASTY
jgi:hypothetical protein